MKKEEIIKLSEKMRNLSFKIIDKWKDPILANWYYNLSIKLLIISEK